MIAVDPVTNYNSGVKSLLFTVIACYNYYLILDKSSTNVVEVVLSNIILYSLGK